MGDDLVYLVLAVGFTVCISALCSVLEAMILSTTTTEIEGLKQRHPLIGARLERFKIEIEETTSAILSLNTIANTAGASVSGALAATALGEENVVFFSAALVMGILIFSEVIPKNIGVLYRPALQPILIYPLHWIRIIMLPVSFLCKIAVRFFVKPQPSNETPDEEILLLAEKSAKDGDLTESERRMISNALSLDTIPVSEIMTPRTVVTALEKDTPVEEVIRDFKNIPFARIPVYHDNIDEMIGVVRRRDLLAKMADGEGESTTVGDLMYETVFIPENATASDALQIFLKNHQQLGVVVDEYGSVAGVLTMEDVMESILGQEIFEHDDVAIDMRELARKKSEARKLRRTSDAAKDSVAKKQSRGQ
ncbi:hemolysin family protein [Puniceicoccus vermicola]|uniref:HlyC/CorC family transporter n=1 Tax=Puniceicoccus vermicola TaxID=388746 RepID=A0A7X1AZV9_9BACT|nr:hemolysin family protein [Puniceicoccus vermicola]MBC2601920.1 HlyC/CorC family transporter [Puniceicoccus vermicola]